MASGLLPKSPLCSSRCDEIPHIFIPKSHLEPREFLISSAKRLLQQYRHLADNPTAPVFVGYWTNNGQRSALGPNRYAAIDPKATLRSRNKCSLAGKQDSPRRSFTTFGGLVMAPGTAK